MPFYTFQEWRNILFIPDLLGYGSIYSDSTEDTGHGQIQVRLLNVLVGIEVLLLQIGMWTWFRSGKQIPHGILFAIRVEHLLYMQIFAYTRSVVSDAIYYRLDQSFSNG